MFFNVATVRHCVMKTNEANFDPDSTCLPNEKCINGECKMYAFLGIFPEGGSYFRKLWPGEYGCTTDEECTARCPNTYCEKKKSDKSVAQCQCADGFLLYGRCRKIYFLNLEKKTKSDLSISMPEGLPRIWRLLRSRR